MFKRDSSGLMTRLPLGPFVNQFSRFIEKIRLKWTNRTRLKPIALESGDGGVHSGVSSQVAAMFTKHFKRVKSGISKNIKPKIALTSNRQLLFMFTLYPHQRKRHVSIVFTLRYGATMRTLLTFFNPVEKVKHLQSFCTSAFRETNVVNHLLILSVCLILCV